MLYSRGSQPRFKATAWCESVRSVRSSPLVRSQYHMREAGAAGSATLLPDIQPAPSRRPSTLPKMRPPSSSGAPSHVGTVAAAAASAYEDGQHSRRSGPYSYSGRPWHQRWNQTGCSNSWRRTPDKDRPLKPHRRFDDHRYWLHASEPTICRDKFILVSYNILSADNAKDHWHELYNHIPYYVMDWNRRKHKLVQELGLWSPDIICLQEVDRYSDLQEELDSKGYSSIFQARTGKATDGCAIFWRKNRFRLKQHQGIEFRDLDLRDNVAQLCLLEVINKDNGEISGDATGTAREKTQVQDGLVLVGNIHVLFNPKRGDIKLGQVRVLLERAQILSKEFGGVPVLIAGDFNSTPVSPLYHFLSTSELDVSSQDRRRISGQVDVEEASHFTWRNPHLSSPPGRNFQSSSAKPMEPVEKPAEAVEMGEVIVEKVLYDKVAGCSTSVDSEGNVSGEAWETVIQINSGEKTKQSRDMKPAWSSEELKAATGSEESKIVRHGFNLSSAYSQIQAQAGTRDAVGEPLVTSFHQKFMGTVDYIWHTDGLRPLRVLDTLPSHVLQRTRGFPTQKWGSDHLALACEFGFVDATQVSGGDQTTNRDVLMEQAT